MSKIIESISDQDELLAIESLLNYNKKSVKLVFDFQVKQLKELNFSNQSYSIDSKLDFSKIENIMFIMEQMQVQNKQIDKALEGLNKVKGIMYMPITPENNEETINHIKEMAHNSWIDYKEQNEGYNYVMDEISKEYYDKKDQSNYFNEKMLITSIKNNYENAKDDESKRRAIQEMLYIEQLTKNPTYADRFGISNSESGPHM